AREHQTTAKAVGQQARKMIFEPAQAGRLKDMPGLFGRNVCFVNSASKPEILDDGEFIFYSRAMAEVYKYGVIVLPERPDIQPIPEDRTCGWPRQSAQQTQQAGFSASVRSRQLQEFARGYRET